MNLGQHRPSAPPTKIWPTARLCRDPARRHGAPVVEPVPVDAGSASFRRRTAARHGLAGARLRADARPTSATPRERPTSRSTTSTPSIVCVGILAVQIVTMTLAGYAFARLRFPGRDVLFYALPAAAHAGAAGADRAQPAHRRRSRPLRHAARRHGALLRLGLRHLPDAPDLPRHAARLRGGRRDRRRAVVGRSSGTCCCRWPSPA